MDRIGSKFTACALTQHARRPPLFAIWKKKV